MPIYEFFNTETEEYFEDILSYADKERLLELNPHIIPVPSRFGIVSMVGDTYSRTDDTWKEVLSKVAEAHPNSEVGDRYKRKSIKDVKNDQIISKHKKKWNNN